ncbi:polycystin-1-like protein 2 [Crassostrea virginica]
MSLKVKCTSCSTSDEENAEYKWNLMKYDPVTKTETTLTGWENWLETETTEQKFVVKANSFIGLSYYMLTVRMNVSDESWSEMRMILETTAPPYDGHCFVYNVSNSVVELEMRSWKDEGFRKQKNVELDWKEQISYRIFQEDTRTKEKSLVYQGFERHIKGLYFNYGYAENNWMINIYAEVLDVFGDFITCYIAPIKMLSPMRDISLDSFLANSQEFVETAIAESNAGLVSMSLETTISTSNREELPKTGLLDQLVESPETWSSIGSSVTFDSLFQELTPSDQNSTSQEMLKEGMQNMTVLLKTSTNSLNLDSTVLQRQMAFCAGSSMEKKQLVTLEAMGTALDATDDVINFFINTSERALFPVYEDYLSTSEAILRSVDNMLNIFIPKLSPDIPETDDVYQIADEYTSADAVNGYDGSGFSPQERALFVSMSVAKYNEILNSSLDMANQTVPNVQRSIVELGTVLKEITFRKQFEVEVTRPGLKTSMERVPVDREIDRKNLKIKFDSPKRDEDEYLQVTQYSKTPFIWDSESKNIQSPTVHIVLGNRSSLPSVKTKFSTSGSVAKKQVALAFLDDSADYSSQTFNYKIWWKNPSDALVFNIETDLSNVTSFSHVVYAKKDGIPTTLDYEWTKIITQIDWVDGGASCLIPANFCSKPCLMYFAVHVTSIPTSHHRRRRRSVINSTQTYNGTQSNNSTQSFNSTHSYNSTESNNSTHSYNSTQSFNSTQSNNSARTVNYNVSGWTTGCRVWDGVKWDKTSCQLSSETNYKETVCECPNPPGDNFATSFFVPPNSIDFSTVFDKFDIIGNGAVFGTVIAIVVLYVIGLLVARRFDRKDREKWKLFYMSDNLKTDKYVYLVTVYTGLSRNSGTKSNISFVIAGQLKDTGIRRLTNGDDKGFETGSVCTYVMTAQQCLGDLTYLNIWHDNSGKGGDASWNLVKMVVEDAHTGKRYVFFCNRWLSLDSYDSYIQCTVPVASPESLQTFNFNFTENTRENVTDSHLWLSVIFRPERSTFSRCERLSCCASLLFLTMISNAMFYGKDEAVEQIRIGPIKFALSSIYISFIGVILTFPVILAITMIFKKSKWQDEINDRDKENVDSFKTHKKEIKCRLPPRCLYAAYIIVALSIVVSGFFVILYSMEWGKEKSEEWLKTFFLSLLESLLVVDPIKVLAMAVFVSIIAKQSLDDSLYETTKLLEQSQDRAVAFARDTNDYSFYGAPFSEETLENMKRKRLQELRMKRIFAELLLYVCFLVVLYFISYNNRDFNSFQMRRHLSSHLLHSPTKNSSFHTLRYDKVKSTDHFYDWLLNTCIPFVFPLTMYNGQALNAFERQYTNDQTNYRLGPVRLRQLRAKQTECYIPLILDAICYADYNIVSEDDRSDCQSWGLPSCDVSKTRWSSKAWQFTSAAEIWGVPTMGFQGTYGGGGYIADLGIHRMFAKAIVDELFSNKWIDRQTRAVFVEFTQYNSNTNLFTFVSLMAEFPQTGGVLTTAHVYPLRVYQHVGSFGIFIFLCEIVLIVCAIVFFIYFIVQIVKHKKEFFRDNWRIFDLLILVLTIFGISMYLTRMLFTSWTITKFNEQKLKFVNFGHIALWDEVLNAFLSFLVFLSTLRVLRVLNYSRNITHLAGVLSNARRNLLGCFFMFALIFLAYAGVGFLLFGSQLETYKNLFVSITTIVNSLVGRNSLHGLIRACPVIAEFYYFTFVMFVIWIVMTMMSATLNRSIQEVRNKLERREQLYDVDDLLRDFLKDFWHNINFKLHNISKDSYALKRTMTSVTSGDVSLVLQELDDSSCNDEE